MSEKNTTTLELASGLCIEVCGTKHPYEGKLVGYAIHFSGGWNAYCVSWDGSLLRFANNVSREEAIQKVRDVV